MIAAEESSDAAVAQDENWHLSQLKGSIQLEALLHRINGNDPNSEPDLLFLYEFAFDSPEIHKRGLPIQKYVRSRKMSSSNDKSFKPPTRIGKIDKLKEIVECLKMNPDSPVTDKEDSWLFRMYQCLGDRWTLSAVVLSASTESSPVHASPSILERIHIVTSSHTQSLPTAVDFPIIDNQGLLVEACQCISSCTVNPENTSLVRSRVSALFMKILKCYRLFKQHDIPNTAEFQFHWMLMAYDINITRCLEIIGICGQIMNNVETASIEDSLLRPKGVGSYLPHDDDCYKDKQGLGLRHDNQRARFVFAVVVDGSNKSFYKQHTDNQVKSNNLSTELG